MKVVVPICAIHATMVVIVMVVETAITLAIVAVDVFVVTT